MRRSMLQLAAVGLFAIVTGLFAVIGCSSNDKNATGSAQDNNSGNTVVIDNFNYSPSSITVSVGDKVVWRNDDNVSHTVTSDTGSELDSGSMSSGNTYEHTFNTAGTYPYHCTFHAGMTGTVIVQ